MPGFCESCEEFSHGSPTNQRQLLERSRLRVHQIGFDLGQRGMQDDEIMPFLLQQRRPTFFTRDDDFYHRRLCHRRFCLVYLAVEKNEVAPFIRKLLRHRSFDTQAKRLGAVIRVSSSGLSLWRIHSTKKISLKWDDSEASNGRLRMYSAEHAANAGLAQCDQEVAA